MRICQKLYFELVFNSFTKAGQVFANFVCGIIKNINVQYKLMYSWKRLKQIACIWRDFSLRKTSTCRLFNWKIRWLLIRSLLIIRKVFVSFIRCFIDLCYFNTTHFHQSLKSISISSISLIKLSLSRAVSIFFFQTSAPLFPRISFLLFVLILQSIYFTSFVVLFSRCHAL